MAEISTRAVRAVTDRQTDKPTTVTLLRMRRGLMIAIRATQANHTSNLPTPRLFLTREGGVWGRDYSSVEQRPRPPTEKCPLVAEIRSRTPSSYIIASYNEEGDIIYASNVANN